MGSKISTLHCHCLSHPPSSKESTQRDKARKSEVTAELEKIGTSFPRRTSLPKTSGRERRMRYQRSTHTSFAMDLMESLNALNGASLLPCLRRREAIGGEEDHLT